MNCLIDMFNQPTNQPTNQEINQSDTYKKYFTIGKSKTFPYNVINSKTYILLINLDRKSYSSSGVHWRPMG